ncbi:6-phosphogluconolactonase [Acetobacter oryzoeni]|uniref:6-phosphogluconolactonase n=1 Tax=Acetobacter oryzoeni TaxID=2500548 RepID=A0A5B9GKV2_9PROT|nr:6-phosphogluconolactonase [Acetobacter oryzoeni]MCP1202457.1 6-phosphogluconolactonase [Acetobacter oryzoeni]QEE86169.1 6-phosphogluconolactonase [Acetobacter oryzoeni]
MTEQTTANGALHISATRDSLMHDLADWLVKQTLQRPDAPFRIALSGGSTPQHLYRLMTEEPYASRFPWQHMQFFLGDDRFVPHDHADSNYGMMRRLLFSRVPVPAGNIFPMPDKGTAEQAAKEYEVTLKQIYQGDALRADKPLFDVNLLGLGTDGHTASLFPGQPVLQERTAWVAPCVPPVAPHTRLTLTYPAIHASRHVIFLVEGADKKEAVTRVRAQDPACPASAITSAGDLIWFLDQPAAPAPQN